MSIMWSDNRLQKRWVQATGDFEADWMVGCSLFVVERYDFLWMDDRLYKDKIEEVKKYATWVQSGELRWAYTDGDGNIMESPQDMIHQTWHSYNDETKRYEETERDYDPLRFSV